MFGVLSASAFVSSHLSTASRLVVKMSAAGTTKPQISLDHIAVKPPSHPTYDLKGIIKLALTEDAGDRGDVTCMATIPAEMEVEAHFLAKEDGVIAGIALAEMVFSEVDPLLKVLIGGGQNHRMGLFDMVMIKDNHISTAGGVKNALRSVDLYLEENNLCMPVEVETRTLEEVHEVLQYASQNKTYLTRIMLDNMIVPQTNGDVDVSMLKDAVDLINGRFDTEASGNVTLETVHKIGQTGVTYISSGALTHSVRALDISLKIDTELALEVGRRTKRA